MQEFRRVLLHVDMDSFYASCELSLKPELRDKPFVVGANPLNGKGRGVVLACNYPARKFGLRSGMPISTAWRLCPQAHFVPPQFDLYDMVSSRVMKLIRPFADKLEQVSIDEAYLDVTERVGTVLIDTDKENEIKVIEDLCNSIRRTVSSNEGITCSIGVAETKIVAKIATDFRKPDGLTIIRPRDVLDFLAPLEVSRIPGVGSVTKKILQDRFQVNTISQLSGIHQDDLRIAFGRTGIWLLNAARGIDDSPVIESSEPVSVSGELTFLEDEDNYTKIRETLREVVRDVHTRTVNGGFLFRSIGIKVRYAGFETHTRSRSFITPTDSLVVIERESLNLLSEFETSKKKVRLIGVRVSNLLKRDKLQLTLQDWNP